MGKICYSSFPGEKFGYLYDKEFWSSSYRPESVNTPFKEYEQDTVFRLWHYNYQNSGPILMYVQNGVAYCEIDLFGSGKANKPKNMQEVLHKNAVAFICEYGEFAKSIPEKYWNGFDKMELKINRSVVTGVPGRYGIGPSGAQHCRLGHCPICNPRKNND